jgi:hypothetical protein
LYNPTLLISLGSTAFAIAVIASILAVRRKRKRI